MATVHDALPEISWRGEMCKGWLSTKTNYFRRSRGLAELVVGDASLRIVSHRPTIDWDFRIAKADVVSIEPAGFFPWFWLGVRIRHARPDLPRRLMFHTWDVSREALLEACRARGYAVG